MKSLLISYCLLFSLSISSVWAIDIRISDTRKSNFYMDALAWLLEKSGEEYNLVQTKHSVTSQGRKVLLVKQGELDLLYAGTSIELESELLPIRFPIVRGLIGQRIFIIHRNYQSSYDQVKNLNNLRAFLGVQGVGWGDKQVLEASGLNQVERLYDDIFENINSGSRYYFPRGVTEVFAEVRDREERLPNLAIEKNLLLTYKTAVFFFINPSNQALEAMLTQGFIKGYEDGSYEAFFYQHPLIKNALEQGNLSSRIKIDIPNPYLTPETQVIDDRYWHQN